MTTRARRTTKSNDYSREQQQTEQQTEQQQPKYQDHPFPLWWPFVIGCEANYTNKEVSVKHI